MLNLDQVRSIVNEVAVATLPPKSFEEILAEPAIDSEGHDALRITIVLEPDVIRRVSGDAVLDTLFQTQKRLSEAGDERFPLVEYATREELDDVGDS